MFETLNSVGAFALPPDSGGSVRALARIGYDLPDALADIIDNSIDAKASRVEITLFRNDTDITAITIADNGHGMDDTALRHGMQFGTRIDHGPTDLGVFGLGMKSASLSQSKSLTVITRCNGVFAACRWTEASIKRDWQCEILDPTAAGAFFLLAYSRGHQPTASGTVVIWDKLTRVKTSHAKNDLDEFLTQTVCLAQSPTRLNLSSFPASQDTRRHPPHGS